LPAIARSSASKRTKTANRCPSAADHRDVQAWLDCEFFEADIHSETCTAKWLAGERIDWQMAVSALY
jgi:hypothetical protein